MNNNGYDQNGYNPPPPNYGQAPHPNYGFNPPPKRTNSMAVASLVLGIVGFVLSCCCFWVSIVCSVLAIVFAIISRRSEPNGRMSNMAVAGLIIGAVSLAMAIVVLVIFCVGGYNLSFNIDDLVNDFQDLPSGEFSNM
jgi:lysylphosphatidylglycerol synthetase-like protein (DUF2156 family)